MDRVKELMDSTGCEERLAILIDRFTDGDIEKAKKIISSIPKDQIVLTVRLFLVPLKHYVLIICIRNLNKKKNEFFDVLVSTDSDLQTVNSKSPLDSIRRAFENWRASGKVIIEDVNKIRDFLSKDEVYKEIIGKLDLAENENNQNIEDFKTLFKNIFDKIYPDVEKNIEVSLEKTDAFRLYSGEKDINKFLQPESESTDKSSDSLPRSEYQSAIFLTAQPVISPASGKIIPKCKKGDVIYTEITDTREFASYLKKLLLEELKNKSYNQYNEEMDSKRLPAVIEEMEYSTNTENVSIIVRYGPGIYGRILVPRDLKIEVLPNPESVNEETKTTGALNWLVWFLIISFAFVIILMLILKK